jgi:hypothetical protein
VPICIELRLDNYPFTSDNWLASTQSDLYNLWSEKTKHIPNATNGTWACEIARGCRTCREHLSLPCSLLSEANEVGSFLSVSGFSQEPSMFLRLYLIILSEFTSQIEQIGDLMKLDIGKKPRLLALWANRWAKHRMQILLQHHPMMSFADAYGERWSEVEEVIRHANFRDKCGNEIKANFLDTKWLEENVGKRLRHDPNGPGRSIILVPHMKNFLVEVIQYFRDFVDACLSVPDRIRRFESAHYSRC